MYFYRGTRCGGHRKERYAENNEVQTGPGVQSVKPGRSDDHNYQELGELGQPSTYETLR
jgi:hypothetical protein